MEWLLFAIAFYLVLFGTTYLLIFFNLKKVTIQYPQYELQPSETVPTYLKPLFKHQLAELSPLGFKFCGFLQTQPMIKLDFPKDWEMLLYHPTTKTYAIAGIRQGIEPTNLFNTTFHTFFKDRTLLLTLNGNSYGVLGEIPNTVLEDPYTPEIQVHWQAHEARLQQLAATKTPVGLAPAAFLKALQQHLQVYIDHHAKVRHITQVGPEPLFHWRTGPLLKTLHHVKQGASKEAAIAQKRKQLALSNPNLYVDIPVELEVRQFQRMEQLQRGYGKSKLSLWVILLSFVAFVAAYTSLMSVERLAIFVGVLLLHEGGHILAMKLCGYRDTSMLFLPFLGALATARKDDATVTQKFWVSFAGPMPGLILGIGLAIATQNGDHPEWMTEATWMLIGLNLFNLLPVYPLDGGQIADLLVFSRVPLLGVLFKSVGVLLLVLLGLGQPMLLGFAVLIGLTIPTSFRSDRINAKLRQEFSRLPQHGPERSLALIFTKLKQDGQGTLPFARKYALVKTLVQKRSEAQAKWTTQLFLSLLYSVSLMGGLVGVLTAVIPNWHTVLPAAFEGRAARAQREVEAATAAIAQNPKDGDAYLKRGKLHIVLENYDAAIADANQVIQLEPTNSKGYFMRSTARQLKGDAAGATADSQKGAALYQAEVLAKASQEIRRNPQDADAYLSRATAHTFLKNYKEAIADCNQVLRLNPQNTEAYIARGNVWSQLKNYKRAIADANQAIRFDPNLVGAYELRAESRRQLGDQAGAIADERRIDELIEQTDDKS